MGVKREKGPGLVSEMIHSISLYSINKSTDPFLYFSARRFGKYNLIICSGRK
jgi:hypothetical protein